MVAPPRKPKLLQPMHLIGPSQDLADLGGLARSKEGQRHQLSDHRKY